MGFLNPPVIVAILGVLGVLSTSFVISAKVYKKRKNLKKVNNAETIIRNSVNHQDLSKAQKCLKTLVKTRYKSANEKIIGNKEKRQRLLGYFKTCLAEATLKGKKPAVINKLQEKINNLSKDQNGQCFYTQKIRLKDAIVEFSANSIVADSNNLVSDYKQALNEVQNQYPVRKGDKGVYPMVTEIQDENGKVLMKISDISPKRYFEFTQKILAKFYQKIEDVKTENIYKIFYYDTFEEKNTSYKNRHNCNFVTADQLKNAHDKILADISLFEGHVSAKGSNNSKNISNNTSNISKFNNLVDYYKCESKLDKLKDNMLYFESGEDVSNTLQKYCSIYKEKSKYYQQRMMTVCYAGEDVVTLSSQNSDAYPRLKVYLLAYACVLAYKKEQKKMPGIITINCTDVDFVNKSVSYNVPDNYISSKSIYSTGKLIDSNFLSYVLDIAREQGLDADKLEENMTALESAKVTPKTIVKDDFIKAQRSSLTESFNAKALKEESSSISYITKIESTPAKATSKKFDFSMITRSRAIQNEYFLELLIEAYVMQKRELDETSTCSQVVANVLINDEGAINRKGIERIEVIFKTPVELKSNIISFVEDRFKENWDDKTFETKIKHAEDEMFPSHKSKSGNVFQF